MGNVDSKAVRVNGGGGGPAVANGVGNEALESTQPTATLSKDSHTYSELSSFEAHHEDAEGRKLRSSKKKRRQNRLNNVVQARDDEHNNKNTSQIPDDQVHVNLAMSDLMAYLQVVANNSSNLPVTRRDDPESDHSVVTTLTPEDYARKAAAFVPADVRAIGGTFTRYGRVWDLPTSDEYNVCDGAQEPGKSYGAACSNALLKVLYDAANDAADVDAAEANPEALFDDDEDDEESTWGKSLKSGFSLEGGMIHQTTISWSDLLKKMKAEIKDIEYAQIPKITSTRKLDLKKPFTLVPENFDATKGKKRSLLIGCNYRSIPGAELKASHDDIRSMKDYIVNVHGFPETKGLMTILLDDDAHEFPTFMNIIEAFKRLSEESQPGDAVFIQFSGHGGRVLDAPTASDSEPESYDEVIVPCDYKTSGLIRDTLMFKTLLAPMRYGVTVTIITDCCDTGMVMELPYAWSTKVEKRDAIPKMQMNEDFSFVRFLKVVKTLYETSTFTQLGKTVGSALKPSGSILDSDKDDAEMDAGPARARKKVHPLVSSQETFLDAITDVCKPTENCENIQTLADELSKRDGAPKQSLLEQVMNCTLLSHPEEEEFFTDDEDTYKTRTEEETEGATESFESLTDDDEDYTKRPKGARSRRPKAR